MYLLLLVFVFNIVIVSLHMDLKLYFSPEYRLKLYYLMMTYSQTKTQVES